MLQTSEKTSSTGPRTMDGVKDRAIATLTMVALTTLAGCISTSPSSPEPEPEFCPDGYPTQEELYRRWNNLSDDGQYETEEVPLALGGWRQTVDDMPRSQVPEHFIEWKEYNESVRPSVIDDLLCSSLGTVEANPNVTSFTSRVFPPRWLVWDTLDALADEHQRQTGVALDWRTGEEWEWPRIHFADHMFKASCHGWVAEYVDRHESRSCRDSGSHGPS